MTTPAPSRVLLLLAPFLSVACAGVCPPGSRPESRPPEAATVVLLVRHAEKVSEEKDPPLSAAGRARAEALRRVAGEAGVSAIFVTQYIRTQETARPLAERTGVPVLMRAVESGQAAAHAAAVAGEILQEHRGKTVLVVGHSNTVPLLAEALAGAPVPPMDDHEYDRLTLVVVPSTGPAKVLQTRFGAP